MSNTIPNPVAFDVEPVDVESTVLPEAEAVAIPETEEPAPKKGGLFSRIIGALLAVISVAVLFLNVKVLIGTAIQETSLFKALKDLLSSNTKLFGILPALADTTTAAGQIATVALYAFVLCVVLTVVFGVLAAITTKFVSATVTAFSLGFTVYAFSVFATSQTNALDVITAGVAAVGIVLFFVFAFRKYGKALGLPLLQFVLTFVAFFAIAYGATKYYADFEVGAEVLGVGAELLFTAIITVLALATALSYIGLISKKCLGCDIARAIVQFIIALVACYVASAGLSESWIFVIAAVAAAIISLIQIVIGLKIIENNKKKAEAQVLAEEEAAAEAEAQAIAEAEEALFVREEYAEALPYEGGPVEGVEIAEEVNPTFIPQPAEVKTAGYDFYNCKSFDPFIASLNEQERNDFTQIFILKYKGVMPEIPDYVVGGDNKDFFQKLFIYLGQYRDRIPSELLAKMYQFAIKM